MDGSTSIVHLARRPAASHNLDLGVEQPLSATGSRAKTLLSSAEQSGRAVLSSSPRMAENKDTQAPHTKQPYALAAEMQPIPDLRSMQSSFQLGPHRAKYSPELWEYHRSDIEHLYLDEGKPLREVMWHMSSRGFHASVKMYKRQLSQWQMFKNNRKRDVSTMLHVQRQRRGVGKQTIFQRNNKEVDIARYLSRNGIVLQDLGDPANGLRLPSNIACRTPTPDPEYLQSPDTLHFQECLTKWGANIMNAANDRVSDSWDRALKTLSLYTIAMWLLSQNRLQEAYSLFAKVFERVHEILEVPSGAAVLGWVMYTIFQRDVGVSAELWKYLSSYAAIKLSKEHEIRQILESYCHTLRIVGFHNHTKLLGTTLNYMCQITSAPFWSWFLGATADQTRAPMFLNSFRHDFPSFFALPASALHLTGDVRGCVSGLWLSAQAFGFGQEELLEKCVALREANNKGDKAEDVEFLCLCIMARYHRAHCAEPLALSNERHNLATAYLTEAIEFHRRNWEDDCLVLELLTFLEDWYRERGNEVDADRIKTERSLSEKRAIRFFLSSV